jgi:acetylornithine deacetylase/succinyl-diaminopimelate desuccinylase-like protein
VPFPPQQIDAVKAAIQPERLLDTAVKLIGVPSPTRSGAAVADRLHEILESDGFPVERPACGWPDAPAVVARFDSGRRGKTLQFNGHLDTVHLPFVPPRVQDGILYGSGAIDMKGGVAAMVEALRAVRDSGLLAGGGILLTAHDLHEAPWGDGSQVDRLIEAGYAGDGALIPEYTAEILPVVGRGLAVLEVTVTRDGEPVHEVLGGIEQPSVIAVGADLVRRLTDLHRQLGERGVAGAGVGCPEFNFPTADSHAQNDVYGKLNSGHPTPTLKETVFIGQVHAGEIYNQSPTQFRLSGTRRWTRDSNPDDVRREFFDLLSAAEEGTGTHVEGEFHFVRNAFELDERDWLVESFQEVCRAVRGEPLPTGVKPFVDDGNTFCAHGIPCVTHGPRGSGAHTLHEQVSVAELERVAQYYALCALRFCDA